MLKLRNKLLESIRFYKGIIKGKEKINENPKTYVAYIIGKIQAYEEVLEYIDKKIIAREIKK